MRRRFGLCVLILGVGATSLGAQRQAPPPPPNPLASVPTFRCSFPKHVATEWVNGQPATVAGEEEFSFQVTAFDTRRGSARLVGSGGGSADVTAMLTGTGMNVIEQTGLGNFILTTIFIVGAQDRVYPAVHSRHLGDLKGLPSVSQHFGTCEATK